MFEIFAQELKFMADFTQKWASVDMNWEVQPPNPRQFQTALTGLVHTTRLRTSHDCRTSVVRTLREICAKFRREFADIFRYTFARRSHEVCAIFVRIFDNCDSCATVARRLLEQTSCNSRATIMRCNLEGAPKSGNHSVILSNDLGEED